jgi:hypothetical protein
VLRCEFVMKRYLSRWLGRRVPSLGSCLLTLALWGLPACDHGARSRPPDRDAVTEPADTLISLPDAAPPQPDITPKETVGPDDGGADTAGADSGAPDTAGDAGAGDALVVDVEGPDVTTPHARPVEWRPVIVRGTARGGGFTLTPSGQGAVVRGEARGGGFVLAP